MSIPIFFSKLGPVIQSVKSSSSLAPPPLPELAIVTVSVIALVVKVTLLPATKVKVSVLLSATTSDCPLTAIVLNTFEAPLTLESTYALVAES